MSLAARLTAFAQAVGADIKALNAKVATNANTFRQTAPSAPGATNNWRTIWVSATNEINPAGAFTRNADGGVTVRDAGWYSVSASFRNVTVNALCTFSLTDALNAPGNAFATDTTSLGANYSNVVAGDNYFAAGATIYPNVWTDVATQIELTYFTIARLGGTKGDPGPAGPKGSIPVYEQVAQPSTTEIGAIWIKG